MYDRILVAVDGSPVSDRALEEAIKLAGLSGGKLRVITIVDSPLRHLPDYAVYYNPEPLREAALKAADDVLAKAREKVEASNVEGATFDRVSPGARQRGNRRAHRARGPGQRCRRGGHGHPWSSRHAPPDASAAWRKA